MIGKRSKKENLAKVIKDASKDKVFSNLLCAQLSYSKGSNLLYGKLQMRSYLKTKFITRQQASLIFKFRTRMIPVKSNFKNSHLNDLSCPVCKSGEEDTQSYLIICAAINEVEQVTLDEFNSLFGQNEENMVKIIKTLEDILTQRKNILEASNLSLIHI